MKRVGLVGLSVAAAAMIMGGCGGGGGSSSGLSAPAELKNPTEVNLSQARKVMGMIGEAVNEGGIIPMSAAPAVAATIKNIETSAEKALGTKASAPSESQTYECPVSGTYKLSWSVEETGDKFTYTETCEMKNCVSDMAYVNDDDGVCDIPIYAHYEMAPEPAIEVVEAFTFNGKVTVSQNLYTYNSDANQSSAGINVDISNYTAVHTVDGETAEKIVADFTHSWDTSNDGDFIYYSAEEPSYNVTSEFSGRLSYINYGEPGLVNHGYLMEGDLSLTNDGVQEEPITTLGVDGFMSYYFIAGKEDNKTLYDGFYLNNFMVAYNGTDYPEQNLTVNGEVGAVCLGGLVSVTTDDIMKLNTVDYDNNGTGVDFDTLPYAGKVTLAGTTDANVTFGNDGTYSTATISTSEGDATYGSWSEMAEPCSIIMPPDFPYYVFD